MRRIFASLLALLLALMVVSPAGAAPLSTPVTFYSVNTLCNAVAALDDAWFSQPATTYNHLLCQQSFLLAAASFRLPTAQLEQKDASLQELLINLGFDNYRSYQFDEPPTGYTIANGFATKQLTDQDGDFTLIAIGVSGAGYGDEWLSNFSIEDQSQHAGFTYAAQEVLSRFLSYTAEYVPDGGRVKVWGAGFSRAAAVSNLLGGYLNELSWLSPEDVYIYTFATPNTTKTPVAYPNIFNTCGAMDPVPYVPYSTWGYGKNGITHYLTAMDVDPDYKPKADKAAQLYAQLTGEAPLYSSQSGNWLLQHMMRLLYKAVPSTTVYKQTYQQIIMKGWKTRGNLSDKILAVLGELATSNVVPEEVTPDMDDFLSLLTDAIFGSLKQISGERSTDWIGLFASGSNLAMEHFPSIYYSWIFSADTLEEIAPPSDSYLQMVFSGDFDVEVVSASTGKVVLSPDTDLNVVTLIDMGERHYIILPFDYGWEVTLSAKEDVVAEFGVLVGTIGTVDVMYFSSGEMTMFKGDTTKLHVNADEASGQTTVYATVGNSYIGLSEGRSDLGLGGRRSVDRLAPMVVSASLIIIPQYIGLVLLMFYTIAMGLRKLTRLHAPNPRVACTPIGNILLLIFCVLSLCKGIEHLAYLIITLTGGTPAVQMHKVALLAAEFLHYGQAAYEACSALLYLLLASACFRARIRQRTRARCIFLAILLQLHDLMELIAAILLGQNLLKGILGVLVPIVLIISVGLCRVHGTPHLDLDGKKVKL